MLELNFMHILFFKHSLIRLLWLNLYLNYGHSFVNFKNRVMFEKKYFLKNAYRYVFINIQYNVNTLICITGEFRNNRIIFLRDIARWIQGALEIRVSVLQVCKFYATVFYRMYKHTLSSWDPGFDLRGGGKAWGKL